MQNFEEFWGDVNIYLLDSCLKYHQLKRGIQYANGCGAKGGIKFPDTMYFVIIIAACIIHDIEWKLAKTFQDLLDANERFDDNLKKIIVAESQNELMVWLRNQRAAKYITGVEREGTVTYAIERGFILPAGTKIPALNETWIQKLKRFFIKK